MTRRDFVKPAFSLRKLREKHMHYRFWGLLDSCLAAIDAQYSVEQNGTAPTTNHAPWSTYDVDRMAFYGNFPGGGSQNYDIHVPSQYGSQAEFDAAVIDKGNSYSQGPYDAYNGPNSNTAADNIIEKAGGTAPNVPGAWQQNSGEPSSFGGSSWAH